MGRILRNGAGADTIGAVIAQCPSGALHPGGRGRRTKEATMTTQLVALVLLAALLMLAAVPAEAADVKELFAIDLADYSGQGGSHD